MKALCFLKPHPSVRVYKDGLRLRNPSHSLPSYLSLPLLTSCTTPTLRALSSQGATGAAMATPWGTALAAAMAAPTLQWAMALAMATTAVGLTEDTGHMLSTDVLCSPGIDSSLREGCVAPPGSSFTFFFFRPHLLINLFPEAAFQILQLSLKQRNWKSRWCLKLPSLDAVYWDVFRSLAMIVTCICFWIFQDSHDALSWWSCGCVCQILNKFVSAWIMISLSGVFLVCAYFLMHWVGEGSRLIFKLLASGVVKRQIILDPVW